jgi:hypothetical protein
MLKLNAHKRYPMKLKLFVLLIFSYFTLTCFSQLNDSSSVMIDPVEKFAIFPGGNDSIWCFLEKTFDFNKLNLSGQKGKVFVTFVIDTTGQLKKIKTNPKGISRFDFTVNNKRIEKEIRRAIGLMPNWSPAEQLGHKVKCTFTLPIIIPYTSSNCKSSKNGIILK